MDYGVDIGSWAGMRPQIILCVGLKPLEFLEYVFVRGLIGELSWTSTLERVTVT